MAPPYSNTNTNVLLLCIICLPTYTTAANILAFFPEIIVSQLYIHCQIVDVLAGVGHDVTVIAPASNPILDSRYHFMYVPLPVEKTMELPSIELEYYNSMINHMTLLQYNLELGDLMMEQPIMKQFILNANSNDFDLLILSYQANDFLIGLATLFNCPAILSTTRLPTLYMHELVGNPYELSYVPTEYWTIKQTEMEFIDRLFNIWKAMWYQFFQRPGRELAIKEYYSKHFSSTGMTLAAARNRIALIFTNHHFSQSLIRPNVPAIVEIGGIHISDYKQDLSPDITRHLNRAKDGFYYVNLGSSYNCTKISVKLASVLYTYFTINHMFVVWRWAYCVEPPASPFIHYQNWVDQTALLAHPKLKVFITHGGQNSLTEAIHFSVRMLAITQTLEQEANAEYLADQGAIIHLKEAMVTPQLLHSSLFNLVADPSFKNVITTLSRKYRDRPQTPRQTVLYWVNYVLRYRGAVHLRSPAVDMHYFQRIGLDFLLVTFVILLVFISACVPIYKFLYQPPTQSNFVFTPSSRFDNVGDNQYHQLRPTSSKEAETKKTARKESVEEELPNLPRHLQQRKNLKKNKRR